MQPASPWSGVPMSTCELHSNDGTSFHLQSTAFSYVISFNPFTILGGGAWYTAFSYRSEDRSREGLTCGQQKYNRTEVL